MKNLYSKYPYLQNNINKSFICQYCPLSCIEFYVDNFIENETCIILMSMNKYITIEFVKQNMNLQWCWTHLTLKYSLNTIFNNIALPWDFECIQYHRDIDKEKKLFIKNKYLQLIES